jgi:glucose-6-phosphate isomerase
MAIVAGHVLGIHPFNQPNVESAKVQAQLVAATENPAVACAEVASPMTELSFTGT